MTWPEFLFLIGAALTTGVLIWIVMGLLFERWQKP